MSIIYPMFALVVVTFVVGLSMGAARLISVKKGQVNPKYYKLLQCFKKIANCPVIVNTSFNVRGEPIVCSIEDAYKCFVGTGLDILVCENFILYKEHQNIQSKGDHKNKFSLD